MVEMALGLLVFVTILIFGIFFAEIGYLSVKVPQAAAFAMYEGTGRRVAQYSPNASAAPYDAILNSGSGIDATAKERFADFNALTETGGNTTLSKVFARATELDVNCEEAGLGSGDPDAARIRYAPSPTTAGVVFFDRGGTVCSAQAKLDAVNMPRHFLEDSFFAVEHYGRTAPIEICAFGRSRGGSCPGKVAVLYGDWGLTGANESGSCTLTSSSGAVCTDGSAYYKAVQSMFKGAGAQARSFAMNWAGAAPAHGDEFFMSYRGVEEKYNQVVTGHSKGTFNTGGATLETENNKHFLGIDP